MEEARKTAVGFFTKFFVFATFAIVLFFCRPAAVHAASLYFSPSTGTYTPGGTFTVGVYASTGDGVSANAFSGVIGFDPSLLQVTGVSKSGSIMSLWVAEPSYSNSSGSISFDGIVLNPGYTGNSGKIMSVSFKAMKTGSTNLSFSSGLILANDGLGTNILTGRGTGSYSVEEGEAAPAQPASVAPAAPAVSSSTHPDQNGWYAQPDVAFSWPLLSSVTGVNVLADHEPQTDPGTRSDGLMSRYTYTDVEDGIWYFHIRLQNEKGWGSISHFKFQIDTVSPENFRVSVLDGAQLVFDTVAKDALSGVREYKVFVDDALIATYVSEDIEEGATKTLVGISAGNHAVTVRAYDAAGNESVAGPVAFAVAEPIPMPPAEQVVQLSPYGPRMLWGVVVVVLLVIGILLLLALLRALLGLLRHVKIHIEKPKKLPATSDAQTLKEMKALRKELITVSARIEKLEKKIHG